MGASGLNTSHLQCFHIWPCETLLVRSNDLLDHLETGITLHWSSWNRCQRSRQFLDYAHRSGFDYIWRLTQGSRSRGRERRSGRTIKSEKPEAGQSLISLAKKEEWCVGVVHDDRKTERTVHWVTIVQYWSQDSACGFLVVLRVFRQLRHVPTNFFPSDFVLRLPSILSRIVRLPLMPWNSYPAYIEHVGLWGSIVFFLQRLRHEWFFRKDSRY